MLDGIAQGQARTERLAAQQYTLGAERDAHALELLEQRAHVVGRIVQRGWRIAVAPEVEHHRLHVSGQRIDVRYPVTVAGQHAVHQEHHRAGARDRTLVWKRRQRHFRTHAGSPSPLSDAVFSPGWAQNQVEASSFASNQAPDATGSWRRS